MAHHDLQESTNELIFRRHPTIADISAVYAAISLQEKAITSIDSEIEALMRDVRRLAHQKSQHYGRIRHLKSLISLATRIPAEMLAIIFEHAASDWARAPLVVSHVCSAWRAAASVPGVWSHIYVNCESRDPYGRTRFWLERAQEASLYIILETKVLGSWLEQVMDLLLDHAAQWRSLTINTLFSHQVNYIISRCNRPTPDLRRVDIRTDLIHQDDDDHLVGFREAFGAAPHLSTVHLSRELSPSTDIIPENITSLYLHLPAWSGPATLSAISVVQLLEGLPLLQQFTMEFPMYHERTFVPAPDATQIPSVPYLQSLTLVLSPNANAVLSYIHAPALRHLHLRSSGETSGQGHAMTGASLVQFMKQSSPPLELLDLHDIDLLPDDFARCFAASPSLRELRLHESEITDDVIHLFNGPTGVCPQLTRLDLRWCGLVTGRALVELVQSRLDPTEGMAGHTIAEVGVLNCSFVKENDIMDLAEMSTCRVVMRIDKDICRESAGSFASVWTRSTDEYAGWKGCCNNERYRQRLRLRHLISLATEKRPRMNLIL